MLAILATAGATLAALIILAPQSISLLIALRTGVIVSRGYSGSKIDRLVDAARFWAFWKARVARLLIPLIIFVVAGAFLAVQLASFALLVKGELPR